MSSSAHGAIEKASSHGCVHAQTYLSHTLSLLGQPHPPMCFGGPTGDKHEHPPSQGAPAPAHTPTKLCFSESSPGSVGEGVPSIVSGKGLPCRSCGVQFVSMPPHMPLITLLHHIFQAALHLLIHLEMKCGVQMSGTSCKAPRLSRCLLQSTHSPQKLATSFSLSSSVEQVSSW